MLVVGAGSLLDLFTFNHQWIPIYLTTFEFHQSIFDRIASNKSDTTSRCRFDFNLVNSNRFQTMLFEQNSHSFLHIGPDWNVSDVYTTLLRCLFVARDHKGIVSHSVPADGRHREEERI